MFLIIWWRVLVDSLARRIQLSDLITHKIEPEIPTSYIMLFVNDDYGYSPPVIESPQSVISIAGAVSEIKVQFAGSYYHMSAGMLSCQTVVCLLVMGSNIMKESSLSAFFSLKDKHLITKTIITDHSWDITTAGTLLITKHWHFVSSCDEAETTSYK